MFKYLWYTSIFFFFFFFKSKVFIHSPRKERGMVWRDAPATSVITECPQQSPHYSGSFPILICLFPHSVCLLCFFCFSCLVPWPSQVSHIRFNPPVTGSPFGNSCHQPKFRALFTFQVSLLIFRPGTRRMSMDDRTLWKQRTPLMTVS